MSLSMDELHIFSIPLRAYRMCVSSSPPPPSPSPTSPLLEQASAIAFTVKTDNDKCMGKKSGSRAYKRTSEMQAMVFRWYFMSSILCIVRFWYGSMSAVALTVRRCHFFVLLFRSAKSALIQWGNPYFKTFLLSLPLYVQPFSIFSLLLLRKEKKIYKYLGTVRQFGDDGGRSIGAWTGKRHP